MCLPWGLHTVRVALPTFLTVTRPHQSTVTLPYRRWLAARWAEWEVGQIAAAVLAGAEVWCNICGDRWIRCPDIRHDFRTEYGFDPLDIELELLSQ